VAALSSTFSLVVFVTPSVTPLDTSSLNATLSVSLARSPNAPVNYGTILITMLKLAITDAAINSTSFVLIIIKEVTR
jgi:hypothetical protein